MTITREDVLKVAKDLNVKSLTEKQIIYCIVEFDNKAEEDPTGYWELWVEQLIEECPYHPMDSDEFDLIEYNGISYPIRILNVTHDKSDHIYQIAPESLNNAMIALEGEDATVTHGTEAHTVDENIYHYVEDIIFYESASYIANCGLDIPMELTNEKE
tara:strand:+ start:685 stop:1158 length:474 start_codon:yes stop_codon:yes gene_type:complete